MAPGNVQISVFCVHLVDLVSPPAFQHIILMSTDFSHKKKNEFAFQISWIPVGTEHFIISTRCLMLEKFGVT